MSYRADDVRRVIPGARLVGNPAVAISHPAALHEATPGSLSWLRTGRRVPEDWRGTALIVCEGTVGELGLKQALITCPNPRLGLGYALRELFDHLRKGHVHQHGSARVHPSAVLGVDGLSLEWDAAHARWFRIPSVAGVTIGQDVRIGALTTVVRGVLSDTIIGAGTDLGNHVNVGHGARLGQSCLIAPFAAIGGSALLGDRVTVWQHAAIRNGVTIGEGATIGQAANVLEDMPPLETWVGNPARRLA